MGFLVPFEAHAYAALRIMAGLMFVQHGLQKIFGLFGGTPDGVPAFIQYGAGGIELVGGALVAIGLLTAPAAFVCSGTMAVAYFIAHQPKGAIPILNQGDLAVLYCFVFLLIATRGAGIWSVDGPRGRTA
jgi:putative oxidoreductase